MLAQLVKIDRLERLAETVRSVFRRVRVVTGPDIESAAEQGVAPGLEIVQNFPVLFSELERELGLLATVAGVRDSENPVDVRY